MSYGARGGSNYGNQRRTSRNGFGSARHSQTSNLIRNAFKTLPDDLLDHSKQVYVVDGEVCKRTRIPRHSRDTVNIHNHGLPQPPNHGDIDSLRKGLLKGNMSQLIVVASETGDYFSVEPNKENTTENREKLIAFLKLSEKKINEEFNNFGWDLFYGDEDPRQLQALKRFADKYGLKVETGKVNELKGHKWS